MEILKYMQMVKMLCLKPIRDEKFVIKKRNDTDYLEIKKNKVGSGSYNVVYPAIVKGKCKESGRKVIYRVGKDSLDDMAYFKQEIKMSIKMSNFGAGPEIYSAGIDSKNRGFVVMEFFPYSVRELVALPSNKDKPSFIEIEKGLRGSIKKMAKAGIFCSDLKFRNAVAKKSGSGKWNFKLIDFGEDFCAFGKNLYIPDKFKKEYQHHIKGSKTNIDNILYCAMLIMMSINSEKTREKFYKTKKPFFSKEIKKFDYDTKIYALLIIAYGKSNSNKMLRPISQAKHYYTGDIENFEKLYQIITKETLKK